MEKKNGVPSAFRRVLPIAPESTWRHVWMLYAAGVLLFSYPLPFRPLGWCAARRGCGQVPFGDSVSADLLSHYVFASLFHQDPRYFYQGTGTKKSRFYHAVSSAFLARSDSGKVMPNYAYFLGAIAAGGAGLVFSNAAIGIAFRAGQSVMQEFLFKRLTKNVPDPNSSENSQPNPSATTQPAAPGRKPSSAPH